MTEPYSDLEKTALGYLAHIAIMGPTNEFGSKEAKAVLAVCARLEAASKARAPTEVEVKALEWQESNEGHASGQWFADSMFGEYCTYMHVPSGRAWLKGPGVGEFYDSLDAAKAAAQLDYATRIRSALVGG